MTELVFKFITIGSVLTSGIAVYIAIRNNSRQVGAHIFLAYSDRIRNLRVTLGENHSPPALLEALYIIFEFYSLRRKGFVARSIWSIWEADITRLLNTPSFRREWPGLRDRFEIHPHFVAWVLERQKAN
jgi:hypothetical protein